MLKHMKTYLFGFLILSIGCQSSQVASSEDSAQTVAIQPAPSPKASPESLSITPSEKKRSFVKNLNLQFFKKEPTGKINLIETNSHIKVEFEGKKIDQGSYFIVSDSNCQKSNVKSIDPANQLMQFQVRDGESFYTEAKLNRFTLESEAPDKKHLKGAVSLFHKNSSLTKVACAEL